MMTRSGAIVAVLLLVALQMSAMAAGPQPPRRRWNTTCILVFGDSTVDPGNNNRLPTDSKANFPPYGKDFFHGQPTGRFCDGRLATDFIAEAFGISKSIPAFLDPNLSLEQLQYGVSFASASSGYDEFTATTANVLPFSKQLEYLMHYKIHLRRKVGPAKAEQTVKNALFVVSAGGNDFIQNYFLLSNRSGQFTVPQYEDFLITLMSKYIKEMHRLGGTKFLVVGLPPMGCLPLVKTLTNTKNCVSSYNDAAISFNSKVVAQLHALKEILGVKATYLDIYGILSEATENPTKYGLVETSKGCCGSGVVEVGEACQGLSTCSNPSRYLYWDAVHLTERAYQVIADAALGILAKEGWS
ncbi:GDSL esterase/lipase At5g45950 [Phoenix dactylifera]|uniref:GDSL esterase/lipase At5g45950 n=1 Tax=Phoenix dactylifera TaxID=42345 RepID=A0A8B7BSH9_PHODC|nr:GDSL esterase/lipase At5g45950 [Phoenix dactylifera]